MAASRWKPSATAGPWRRLRGLLAEGRRPPRAEDAVLVGGEIAGEVTSGNFSPVLQRGIALAFLPPGVGIGAEVDIALRGGTSAGDSREAALPAPAGAPRRRSFRHGLQPHGKDAFVTAPFVPHTDAEIAEMLAFLGISDLDDLFAEIPDGPPAHRRPRPAPCDERAGRGLAPRRARRPQPAVWPRPRLLRRRRLLRPRDPGGREVLASRSEFVTAYTPYQPEVAQGVLQAIFEYQTMIARLSGLEVANASLYDGAASLVEAANLAVAATGSPRVLCSQGVHPHWRRQLETFSRGSGNEIDTVPLSGGVTAWNAVVDDGRVGAVVVATPNFLGCLEDIGAARAIADRLGARLVVCFDPVSAGLLSPPGDLGADVVVGEGQPFGTALGFGGPYLGLFACRLADVRRLPGRLVGETVDREGAHAYVMTLRAREQDIRRERASSNVCTNQTLMAVTAAIQLSWLGPAGFAKWPCARARATRYTREASVCDRRRAAADECAGAARVRRPALRSTPEKLIERLVEDGFLAGVPIRGGLRGDRLRRRAARGGDRATHASRDRRLRRRIREGGPMTAPMPAGRALGRTARRPRLRADDLRVLRRRGAMPPRSARRTCRSGPPRSSSRRLVSAEPSPWRCRRSPSATSWRTSPGSPTASTRSTSAPTRSARAR